MESTLIKQPKYISEIKTSTTTCCDKQLVVGMIQNDIILKIGNYVLRKDDRYVQCSCGNVFIRKFSSK